MTPRSKLSKREIDPELVARVTKLSNAIDECQDAVEVKRLQTEFTALVSSLYRTTENR